MLGQALHAARGHSRGGPDERAHEQAGEALGGAELVLAEHPGEERAQHAVGEPAGHAMAFEVVGERLVRAVLDRVRGSVPGGECPSGEGDPLTQRAQRQQRGVDQLGRRPARVDHRMPGGPVRDDRTGAERAQPQAAQVERAAHLRVARVDQLEAAVEQHAVDLVGAHPAAGCVAGLQDDDVAPGTGQHPGRHQPGKTRADDHDIVRFDHLSNVATGRGNVGAAKSLCDALAAGTFPPSSRHRRRCGCANRRRRAGRRIAGFAGGRPGIRRPLAPITGARGPGSPDAAAARPR